MTSFPLGDRELPHIGGGIGRGRGRAGFIKRGKIRRPKQGDGACDLRHRSGRLIHGTDRRRIGRSRLGGVFPRVTEDRHCLDGFTGSQDGRGLGTVGFGTVGFGSVGLARQLLGIGVLVVIGLRHAGARRPRYRREVRRPNLFNLRRWLAFVHQGVIFPR